jgi:hypothetical protein
MIIKLIPENEFEKEEEYTGVKEFFMFGNKQDEDGELKDFNVWTGSYRYLEGSLYHFLTTITEEKKSKSRKTNEISLKPQGKIKTPFIKQGQTEDIKIIDVDEFSKKAKMEESKMIKLPDRPIEKVDEFTNNPVVDDDNMEAEDKE